MAWEKVVAAYDSVDKAKNAVKVLQNAGYNTSDLSIIDRTSLGSHDTDRVGLWRRLFGENVWDHEAAVYGDTLDKGGAILAVRVPGDQVAKVMALLDVHQPLDVHVVAAKIGETVPVEAKALVTPPIAKADAKDPETLRLAEEQLNVGKRVFETGTTRIRRFVTERPVEAQVSLHEEHAEVVRKAITDPSYVADIDWSDRAYEVTETAEQAVVSKTARVVEEVSLRETGTDRVETVKDTVRRQQVEVEKKATAKLGAEGTPSQRYLVARTDDRVRIGVPFMLTARISTDFPQSKPGQSATAVSGDVTGKLKISIYAPGFTANDGTQREIDITAIGNSPWAAFDLTATKVGLQQIEVLAWKSSVQVGGVTLTINVGAVQPDESSVQGAIEFRKPEDGEYTLEIVFERAPNRYRFQLRTDTGDNWPPMYSDALEGSKEAEYANVTKSLNSQARNANALSAYAQGEWLKGMGATLYNLLIPSDLKLALWDNRNRVKYLNILSAAEPMPWELLYVSDPAGTVGGGFIADTATVTRWRYGPPAGRNFSKKAPYFILPAGSPTKAGDEVTYVRQKLGGGTTIVRLDDLLKLLNGGNFSLLHFASHNVSDPTASAGLYVPFGNSKFDVTFMGAWSKDQFRGQSPLVFMNSCTSGGAVPLYTGMAGWADNFLRAGCGAFIGALWEIRDSSALAFSEKFYDEVTNGNSFADSIRAARDVLKSTDPTYLAYTLYGNPLAKIL